MMSPDHSTANGTVSSKPPATGDSTASSGGGTTVKGALPSIAGGSKTRAHGTHGHHSKHEEEGHGTLPSIGGHTGVSDGSDGDNLPPIGIGKVPGRKAPSTYSNFSSSNYSHASGRSKQQRASGVANKHRSQNNLPKYKSKYSGHA